MIPKALNIVVCASSFLYMFYVLCNFMYFLSSHNESRKTLILLKKDNLIMHTVLTVVENMYLLIGFMLQHSLMSSNFVKHIYYKLNLEDLERSIYNACSAGALHILMYMWQSVGWVTIWNVDTSYSKKLWLIFIAFHVLGWFVIYSGCLMMDISELAGLKQVYYKVSGRPPPMAMKSRELQRYYSHMRHPSFIGFLIILWIHPFMSIDRLLLALFLTVYMIVMWTVDQQDCNYHNVIIKRKRQLMLS